MLPWLKGSALNITPLATRCSTFARKPNGYKLSTDPFFLEKVRDIVCLYLNPPDWTQPLLPIDPFYVEGTLKITSPMATPHCSPYSIWPPAKCSPSGSFSSVKELIAKIEQFVAGYNKTMAPFKWTTTVDSKLIQARGIEEFTFMMNNPCRSRSLNLTEATSPGDARLRLLNECWYMTPILRNQSRTRQRQSPNHVY